MLLINDSAGQAFNFKSGALLVFDNVFILSNEKTALVWDPCACLACEPETSENVEASIIAEDDLGLKILLVEPVVFDVGTPEAKLGVVAQEDIGNGVVLSVCAVAWCGRGCFTHADTEDQELIVILDSAGRDSVGYMEGLVGSIRETSYIWI